MSEWLIERLEEMKRSGDIGCLMSAVPYAKFLGLSADTASGDAICTMRYSDDLIGNPTLPALHGGTLGALLESAAIFQLLWKADTIVLPKTINITVDYLRSGRPVDTLARGIITKHGRRVVNVRAEAWQEDPARPIAIANAHFLIVPSGP